MHDQVGRWLSILGSVFGARVASGCRTVSQAAAQNYITASESQRAESVATGDASVLKRILADDFVWDYPDGTRILWTKAEAVTNAAAGPADFVSDHVEDVHARFVGSTALAQGSESGVRKDKSGKDIRGRCCLVGCVAAATRSVANCAGSEWGYRSWRIGAPRDCGHALGNIDRLRAQSNQRPAALLAWVVPVERVPCRDLRCLRRPTRRPSALCVIMATYWSGASGHLRTAAVCGSCDSMAIRRARRSMRMRGVVADFLQDLKASAP